MTRALQSRSPHTGRPRRASRNRPVRMRYKNVDMYPPPFAGVLIYGYTPPRFLPEKFSCCPVNTNRFSTTGYVPKLSGHSTTSPTHVE
jgi:hypothetical protein